jgi:hypothetical protein
MNQTACRALIEAFGPITSRVFTGWSMFALLDVSLRNPPGRQTPLF